MPRTFIATILSAAIALGTLGSAPAHAQNDQMKRLLGGLATVIILGATYDHLRDKRKEKHRVDRPAPRRDPDYRPDRRHPNKYKPNRHAKIVPARCLRHAETRRGTERYFAKRCLRRNMRNAHRLPQACQIRLRDHGRRINGYAPRCLRDYGWRRG